MDRRNRTAELGLAYGLIIGALLGALLLAFTGWVMWIAFLPGTGLLVGLIASEVARRSSSIHS